MKNVQFQKALVILILWLGIINPVKSNSYFYQGGSITTLASWNSLANGSGTVPTVFTGNHTWTFGNAVSAATLSSSWGISSNAIVNIGDATNAFSLTLSSGAVVGSSNTQINIKNNATLIDNASYVFNISKTNPNTGSTMVFSSSGSQILAFSFSYYNVVINADVSLNAVNVTINGTLTINSGASLTLNSLNLIINGKIAGSGEIVGDNSSTSGLTFNTSTGNLGTLNFQSGSEFLSNLTINPGSSSSSVTLGTDLVIDGGGFGSSATFNTGLLVLNGHTLQFASDCAADFSGGGEIYGSSSSVLEVDNTVNGGLLFNSGGNTMKSVIINSTGNSVPLSSSLNIIDSLSILDGDFDVTGGTLTIKCSSGSVGRISRIGASGSLTGNVTMETFFPSGFTGWSLYGTPGLTGLTFSNFDAQYPMSCSGCTYGQTGTGAWFNSVQGWDESNDNYDTTIVASTAISPGTGYFMYTGTSSLSSSSMFWTFTGPVVQGTQTKQTTSNGITYQGYNLVANPYPSPISATALFNNASNGSDFDGVAYYWLRNSQSGGSAAEFNTGTQSGTGGGTDVIPPGQGFFVLNQSFATTTLNFSESVKTSANTTNLYRPAAKGNQSYVRLRVTGSYDTNDALVFINPNASDGHDLYDSYKMFNTPGYSGGQSFYSQYTSISTFEYATNKYLSQNSFPPSNVDKKIPLLIQVSISGSYTLTADEIVNYPSCVVVHDKLTNAFIDLRVQPSYVFNISDTTQAPRFELYVCANGGAAVSVNELYASSNISIGKDAEGPVVTTNFEQATDAVISVYNIVGQKLTEDVKVSGTKSATHLNNLNLHNQVVMIKVTAGDKSITKKLLIE